MAKAKASSEPDQTVVPFVRERPSRRLWLGAPDEIVNVKPRHPLVAEIEAFLEEVDMSPTFFGYGVMRDPTFVFEARGGHPICGGHRNEWGGRGWLLPAGGDSPSSGGGPQRRRGRGRGEGGANP